MVKYIGRKQKLAPAICTVLKQLQRGRVLYDCCCGSGEISAYWTGSNFMADCGPWGNFWTYILKYPQECLAKARLVNDNIVLTNNFRDWVQTLEGANVPKDPAQYAVEFIALQCNSFRALPVEDKGVWVMPGWDPLNKGHEVVKAITKACGVRIADVIRRDLDTVTLPPNSLVYIDPPYQDTAKYSSRSLDIPRFVRKNNTSTIVVSEGSEIEGVDWTRIIDITPHYKQGFANPRREILMIKEPVCLPSE